MVSNGCIGRRRARLRRTMKRARSPRPGSTAATRHFGHMLGGSDGCRRASPTRMAHPVVPNDASPCTTATRCGTKQERDRARRRRQAGFGRGATQSRRVELPPDAWKPVVASFVRREGTVAGLLQVGVRPSDCERDKHERGLERSCDDSRSALMKRGALVEHVLVVQPRSPLSKCPCDAFPCPLHYLSIS